MGRIHNNMYLEGFFKAFFEKNALETFKLEITRPINNNSKLITFIVGDVKYSIFAFKQKLS